MEHSINPTIIKREKIINGRCKTTDIVIGSVVDRLIHVTIAPNWRPSDHDQYQKMRTISADNMLILNLNHAHAYGHVITETLSELLTIDDTYPDYDCIVTTMTPILAAIIECFSLKLSNKITFISNDNTQLPFILSSKKLQIANHCPKSYLNKVENIKRLKNALHAAIPIIKREKNLLLYCSRCDRTTAKHGRRLTTENEEQVVEILKQHALETGLEFYFWTGAEADGTHTSILKQYELFSNAKLVVGVHGGAFSNIIFLDATKKPKVIEFCPLPGKTFSNLSDGEFTKFAEYNQILFQLPPEVARHDMVIPVERVDSTIDIDELKRILAQ